MRKGCCAVLAALVFAVPSIRGTAQSLASGTLAIEHTTVLPMGRDTALVDHTVLVFEGRIVWLGPSAQARVPRAAHRVDGRGQYLIPGLVDMHVHIGRVEDFAPLLAAGITTVRNMHGGPQHLEWRSQIEKGTLAGPTLFTSGPPIGAGDPRFVNIRTAADAEQIVKQQADAGYDMIKMIGDVPNPLYQRLLEVARVAQMPVVGHVVSNIGLDRTLSAGQLTLEHAYALRQRSFFAPLVGDDSAQLDVDARAIARAGAWVGTTASSRTGRCEARPPGMLRRIAALRRANVRLLAGTDAGIGAVRPGNSLHCELATLVAAGLTPYEALATATANAGAFARLHLKRSLVPFGTVSVGSRADLVLLAADPRQHIEAVGRPTGVVLRGAWIPQ